MTITPVTHVTLDAILFDAPRAPYGWVVVGDNGALYDVICNIDDALYVRGARHGNIARVIRTGNSTVRAGGLGQVRARIDFAEDTGDAAGTLEFGTGEHIGALVRRELLPIMAR